MIPYSLMKVFARYSSMKALSLINIVNKEKLNTNEQQIYICNHTSYMDKAIVSHYLDKDNVVYVANRETAKDLAKFSMGNQVLSVTPSNPYAVREMLKVLKQGKSIMIFPEGKLSVTNNIMKIFPGIAYLSLKTGIPILPLALNGAEQTKGLTPLEGKIPTHYFPKITLYVGEAFTLPKDKKVSLEESTRFIYRKMQETLLQSRSINIQNIHLVRELQKKVKEAPDLIITDEVLPDGTYEKHSMKDLWKQIITLSYLLEPYLKTDKNVGVLLPSTTKAITTIYSLLHKGISPVLLPENQEKEQLISCIQTGQVSTVVTSRFFIKELNMESFIEENKDIKFIYLEDLNTTNHINKQVRLNQYKKITSEPADIILFTSGTEGLPKGIVLSQENMYTNLLQTRIMIDATTQDKIAHILPLSNSFGLLLTFLSTLFLIPGLYIPNAENNKTTPDIMYDHDATLLFANSTFLNNHGNRANPYDFARLRYVYDVGDKLPEEIRTLWSEKFGIRIMNGYLLPESTSLLSAHSPTMYKKDTVGWFVPGVEYRLEPINGVEEGGKLFIKAPNLMKGYLLPNKGFVPHNPNEYIDTGDIVSLEEGFVRIERREEVKMDI